MPLTAQCPDLDFSWLPSHRLKRLIRSVHRGRLRRTVILLSVCIYFLRWTTSWQCAFVVFVLRDAVSTFSKVLCYFVCGLLFVLKVNDSAWQGCILLCKNAVQQAPGDDEGYGGGFCFGMRTREPNNAKDSLLSYVYTSRSCFFVLVRSFCYVIHGLVGLRLCRGGSEIFRRVPQSELFVPPPPLPLLTIISPAVTVAATAARATAAAATAAAAAAAAAAATAAAQQAFDRCITPLRLHIPTAAAEAMTQVFCHCSQQQQHVGGWTAVTADTIPTSSNSSGGAANDRHSDNYASDGQSYNGASDKHNDAGDAAAVGCGAVASAASGGSVRTSICHSYNNSSNSSSNNSASATNNSHRTWRTAGAGAAGRSLAGRTNCAFAVFDCRRSARHRPGCQCCCRVELGQI